MGPYDNLIARLAATQWQTIFSSPKDAQDAENNAKEAAEVITILSAELEKAQLQLSSAKQ